MLHKPCTQNKTRVGMDELAYVLTIPIFKIMFGEALMLQN